MGRYMLGASVLALALTAAHAAAAEGAEPRTATVDEVVVTATKKAQTLQEVPISLAAVGGKTIEDRGFKQFTDLQAAVPNLQIDQTNGNYAITIRGLGSGASNLAFEQSVGLFVDGVYSSRARSLQTPFLDVERVEVVRGPQGALFGKNTNAGAISLVSRAPTDSFQAEARVGGEVLNGGYSASGFVSGPINDQFTARIAAEGGHDGAWMENRLTGKDEYSTDYWAARGQLKWKPTDNFDATLKLEGSQNDIDGGNLVFNYGGEANCVLCNYSRIAGGGIGVAQEWPGFWRTSKTMRPEYNNTKSGNALLTMNWTIADWKLTSLTSYQDLKSDQTIDTDVGALTILDAYQGERSNQFFQELRASRSFANGLDVITGVTYIKSKLKVDQKVYYEGAYAPIPGLPNGIADRFLSQHGESISPYLAVDYKATDHIFLSGSVRYSSEQKKADMVQTISNPLTPSTLPYNIPGKRDESLWDYSAKVRYQFNRNAQVYLSYATGTKGGGFVSNDGAILYNIINHNCAATRPVTDPNYYKGCTEYEPEKAKSWEIGGKFRFWDGRADLNVALFDTEFDNLQVSSYTGTSFITGNAARATSRGVEIENNWRINEYVGFGGNLAYLDAKYDDYPGGPCLYNAPSTCVPATNNLKNTPLTRAPEWKGGLYVQAQRPVGDGWRLSGRFSADYTGKSYFQPDLNPLNAQNGFMKLDARVALGAETGKWEIAVIGRNLTNEATFSQAFNVPLLGGNSHGVSMNPPRMISIEAVMRY